MWLLEEFGFCRRMWRDQVRMANHESYLVERDTVELCVLRAGLQLHRSSKQPSMRYHPTAPQTEKAEFVTKVQSATKVFEHFIN